MSKNELPVGWMNKRIIDITYLLNGFAFKSANYVSEGIRVVRIKNVQRGLIVDNDPKYYPDSAFDEIKKYILKENDLLVSLTGNVGRVGILTNKFLPAALNQRVSCLRVKDEKIANTKFLYYCLQQNSFEKDCIKSSKGVAQLNLSTLWLEQYSIPLAPLPEQERIVAKIEELFSELDKGVENLQTIKQQLKVYRQAVLKDAFEVEDCRLVMLKEISTAISGYAFKSGEYSESGKYRVIKIGNVKQWRFDFRRDDTRIDVDDNKVLEKYLLKYGDCLITLTGSRNKRDYGFVSMVEDENNFLVNQRVAALRFNFTTTNPIFFKYYLMSKVFRDNFFSYETGIVGQGNVGIKALTETLVPLPTIEQQNIIIQFIESRLSVCDKIEQTVDETLQKAESLRQSILKKAFEGKLIEQY